MERRITVLHIIKSLGRGGAEMLLPETLKFHDKSRFDFHYIYFLPWKNQLVESLLRYGGRVTCISATNNVSLLLKFWTVRNYIKKNRIDIVHAHLPWAGIVARLAGQLTKIPVIYTEHNKLERYHPATRTANLVTMNYLEKIIAVSEDVAISIRKFKKKLRADLNVILNGVNTLHFSPKICSSVEIRKLCGIPVGAPVIGTIAVFRFQKRLDLWMEIASKILEKVPETHFIIVGDGPLRSHLYHKLNELRLANRIHFPGLMTDVRPYIAAFDIYMMTSIFEGLPIALLEAMSSECPVITTDAGGIKEVIRPDVDGMLCHVDEPENLIKFAVELLQSPEKRKALGQSARRRIEEKFSLNQMVRNLESLYEEVSCKKIGT